MRRPVVFEQICFDVRKMWANNGAHAELHPETFDRFIHQQTSSILRVRMKERPPCPEQGTLSSHPTTVKSFTGGAFYQPLNDVSRKLGDAFKTEPNTINSPPPWAQYRRACFGKNRLGTVYSLSQDALLRISLTCGRREHVCDHVGRLQQDRNVFQQEVNCCNDSTTAAN